MSDFVNSGRREGKDFLFKAHKSYRWVVSVCDKELYGRKFSEGDRQLDLSGAFFNGEEMSCEQVRMEVIRCLREDATFNVVGEKSVGIFKEMGIAEDDAVLSVEGVPFFLILL